MFSQMKFELESVRRQKSAEVDAMMRLHGLSFTDACRKVALSPTNYICGEPPIEWLPSPEQINEFATAVKSGDIVVGGRSKRLLFDESMFESDGDHAVDETHDQAGEIPDPFEMPAWFGSAM